jgi:hypothetical protein
MQQAVVVQEEREEEEKKKVKEGAKQRARQIIENEQGAPAILLTPEYLRNIFIPFVCFVFCALDFLHFHNTVVAALGRLVAFCSNFSTAKKCSLSR